MHDVNVKLPDVLYTRLHQTARAMRVSIEEVVLRSIQIGGPPQWDDVPAEFQSDLAALDRLPDEGLWQIARSRQSDGEMDRYEWLLDRKAEGEITSDELTELSHLRQEADLFMLRKAHAVDVLRWRGHTIPPAHKLQ